MTPRNQQEDESAIRNLQSKTQNPKFHMSALPTPTQSQRNSVTISVNGLEVLAYAGETVHAALLASGFQTLRRAGQEPRGVFCGMGVCYDCLITVNGRPRQRACMTLVHDQMEIKLDVD